MPRGVCVCVLIYMQIAFTRKKLIIEKIARTPEVVTHSNELPACILYPPFDAPAHRPFNPHFRSWLVSGGGGGGWGGVGRLTSN